MKYWPKNVPLPKCPDCDEEVKPEFYSGFFRIPEHNYADTGEPCGAYGEPIIERVQ